MNYIHHHGTSSNESRRTSLPALYSPHKLLPPRHHSPSPNNSHSCFLNDVAEFELNPPYLSPSTSSSAETTPRMLSPHPRPLSAKLYRKHINLDYIHNVPDDFEDMVEENMTPRRKVQFGGSRIYMNKSSTSGKGSMQEPKHINLKNFNVSKSGKIMDVNMQVKNDKRNRRATCPEIWLSCEGDSVDDCNKTLLRIYGSYSVGKKSISSRIISYANPNDEPSTPDLCGLNSRTDCLAKKIHFLLNMKPHELEVINGSALESTPFQNNLTIYLVIYTIDSKDSFNTASQTLSRLSENVKDNGNSHMILVGNKIDLQRKRKVTKMEGKTLSKIYTCSFIETSALLTVNIDALWKKILLQIQQRQTKISFIDKIVCNGRRITKSCEEIVAKFKTSTSSLNNTNNQ
uniref:GTP-binding protein RAD n=1 Tax=Rhabditophanes sp. KR3021 TaxID=114890 RepID=A0AC35TYE9_9BILA